MNKQQIEQFNKEILISMDLSYEELRKRLDPVFHNKTKYVNGKLLKDCFKHLKDIIQCHHHLRRNINE